MTTTKYDTIKLESNSQSIGHINLTMKLLGKPIVVTPPDGFDVAGAGNVDTETNAPVLDPTLGEWRAAMSVTYPTIPKMLFYLYALSWSG